MSIAYKTNKINEKTEEEVKEVDYSILMTSYNYEVFKQAKDSFFPIIKALGNKNVENNVLEELIDNWKKRIIEVNSAYIEYYKKIKS